MHSKSFVLYGFADGQFKTIENGKEEPTGIVDFNCHDCSMSRRYSPGYFPTWLTAKIEAGNKAAKERAEKLLDQVIADRTLARQMRESEKSDEDTIRS